MKRILLVLGVFYLYSSSLAQKQKATTPKPAVTKDKSSSEEVQTSKKPKYASPIEPIYKLYPTKNRWHFLKLNTEDGSISLVKYTLEIEGRFDRPIFSPHIKASLEKVAGRYTLVPTENMWTFILLDQINGYTWQVQWGVNDEDCGSIFLY